MFQRLAVALLALTGAGLIATGGYLLATGSGGPSDTTAGGDTPLLGHVPADTVFFSGYTAASLPITDVATAWGELRSDKAANELPSASAAAEDNGPGAGLLVGMYRAYLDDFNAGETLLTSFGRASGGDWGFYTVGSLPVMRLDLANEQQFWELIDRIEADAEVSATGRNDSAARSRRYAFDTDAQNREIALLVATHNGDAVVTLTGDGLAADAVSLALGETTPKRSLADSGKLDRLAKQYGTHAGATGFVDHEVLIRGLTGDGESRLGRMLSHVERQWGDDTSELFGSQACRDDARAIAAMWPHTVFGITEVDANAQRVGARIALGLNDDDVLKALRQLRGRMPQPIAEDALLELALGLRVQKAATSIQNLSNRFTGADFDCPQLKQSQKQLAKQGLGRLNMVTRMVGDVRGIGLAVMALRSGSGMSPVTGDAMVEIATPDPQSLWQAANSLVGLDTDNQPEPGGNPVAVSGIGAPGVPTLRVALRQNAVMVLLGDAELDGAAGESELTANGIMRLRYDGAALGKAIQATGVTHKAGSQAQQALKSVRRTPLRYDLSLDIAPSAIRFDSVINVTSPQ